LTPGVTYGPSDLSDLLAEFFSLQLDAETRKTNLAVPPGILGFLVAGYDARGVGRIMEVLLPPLEHHGAVINHHVDTENEGVVYRGRTRYMRRIFFGIDPMASKQLLDALPGESDARALLDDMLNSALRFRLIRPLSVQDALDHAAFVVRTTIDMERLTDGFKSEKGDIPICGGALRALLVSRQSTEWVVRPPLRPSAAGLAEHG